MKYIKNFLNNNYKEILTFIGFVCLASFIWVRFLRTRLLLIIPVINISFIQAIIFLIIITSFIVVLKQQIKPSISFLQKLPASLLIQLQKITLPIVSLDTFIKNNGYTSKILKNILIIFIKMFNTKRLFFKHQKMYFYFILAPKMLLIIIFCMDVFYFHQVKYLYTFIILGALPLIMRYLLYSLQQFIDKVVIFLNDKYIIEILSKDYEESNYFVNINSLPVDEDCALAEGVFMTVDKFVLVQSMAYTFENTLYTFIPQIKYNLSDVDPVDLSFFEKDLLKDLELIISAMVIITTFSPDTKTKKAENTEISITLLYIICWGYILFSSSSYLDATELLPFIQSLQNIEEPFSQLLI